ncbi:MAG: hypothetical protein R3B07_33055 [Polyangiaceae bacterium]
MHKSLALLVLFGCVTACGGGDEAKTPPTVNCPPGQHYDGQYCVNDAGYGGGTNGGGAGMANGGAANGGMGGGAGMANGGSGAVAGMGGLGNTMYQPGPNALPLDAAALAAAEPLLGPLMTQHAPGAKTVGTIGGNFTQGQVLELRFQAQTGKCYTLVGMSTGQITNLDLKLVTEIALPAFGSPVLAADNTSEPNAVVAPAPDCFKWVLPATPVKAVLSAAAGQGTAVARVLEK